MIELVFEFFLIESGDFKVEESDFDGIAAHDLPHGGGEESDEVGFDFVGGVIAGDVGVEVIVIAGGVLLGEGDSGGTESVSHAVGADCGFAFDGDGSIGFGAVGAGGGYLGFGAGRFGVGARVFEGHGRWLYPFNQ